MSIEFFGQLPPWVLGTVSQSGGIPTGALIERNNNANGEYVRLADGTQICWLSNGLSSGSITTATGALYLNDSGGISWAFPAAFVGGVIPIASNARSGNRWIVCTGGATTSANFRVFSASSSATATNFDVMAIGRWN